MEKGRSLPFVGLALPLAAELIAVAAAADDDDDDDDNDDVMATMLLLITTVMMLAPSLISEPTILGFQF